MKVSRRLGVTLVETMIAIAIIVLLVALVLPVLSKAKAKALATDDTNNLRQLGQAFEMYRQAYDNAIAYGAPQLVYSGYVPKELVASTRDTTERGIANEMLLNPLTSTMGNPDLATNYRLSYIGLREMQIRRQEIDSFVIQNQQGGWLVDTIDSKKDDTTWPLDWSGTYRRLLMDGSLKVKPFIKVDCKGDKGIEPCTTQLLLFLDPDERFRKWIISTG